MMAGTCPAGTLPTGRKEGAPYGGNFLCSHSARHYVPGKLFDDLRAVSPAKRGIERPRRACPVLTGWAGSFTPAMPI
jgi:hypothetical protein